MKFNVYNKLLTKLTKLDILVKMLVDQDMILMYMYTEEVELIFVEKKPLLSNL